MAAGEFTLEWEDGSAEDGGEESKERAGEDHQT